jgi:protoporphyrinogen IX oxidase
MAYQALLALHLLAVMIFASGLLLTGLSLPGLARDASRVTELRGLRVGNLYLIGPALGLVWAFGIAMTIEAGWYIMGWLQAKMILVAALSAIHARQTRTLQRLAAGRTAKANYAPVLAATALLIAIVTLVVTKAF